jgi:hypothetical protein
MSARFALHAAGQIELAGKPDRPAKEAILPFPLCPQRDGRVGRHLFFLQYQQLARDLPSGVTCGKPMGTLGPEMTSSLTYKSKAAGDDDRAALRRMHRALHAANSAVRPDACRLWAIQGSRGYVSTWGDGRTWGLTVDSVAARRWTFIKRRLAAFAGLAMLTQDGDDEGVFRLLRLPTREEAAEIRQIAGIRQSRASTPIGRRFTRVKPAPEAVSIAQLLAGLADTALQVGAVVAYA